MQKITENSWEEIKQKMAFFQAMSCEPEMRRLPGGFITDEEESVKWNREQVEKNHQEYDEEAKRLEWRKAEAKKELYSSIYDFIQAEAGPKLNRAGARKIWEIAYASRLYGFSSIQKTLFDLIGLVRILSEKNTDR